MNSSTALLLLAHGSPDTPEDVPCFLHAVTGGRALPEAVVKEVQHRYALIGRSPLRELTMKQAEATQRALGMPVYVGMRNWEPYIRDVVPQMIANGIERAVVICLAPQNSRTSVGQYKKALLGENGQPPFDIDFVESWHDHPLLIEAFAQRLHPGWAMACESAGIQVPVIFTAHSVPTRTITEGDPYEAQARETARLVAASAFSRFTGMDDESQTAGERPKSGESVLCRFAFQSQGMSGGEWLGPTVESTIDALRELGYKSVFIQPIGFLCDHVEILYDIDIMFRQFAEQRGMELYRAQSLNDSRLLAKALAAVAKSKLRTENII